jgi:hypothetical protein
MFSIGETDESGHPIFFFEGMCWTESAQILSDVNRLGKHR